MPLPSVASDPINELNLGWLRQKAQTILSELVAALPEGSRARVQGIPLAVDDTVGEVNAFAACSNGRSLMAITDGLLEIMAWLAMTSATDEVFGGNRTDEYIRFIAGHLELLTQACRQLGVDAAALRRSPPPTKVAELADLYCGLKSWIGVATDPRLASRQAAGTLAEALTLLETIAPSE